MCSVPRFLLEVLMGPIISLSSPMNEVVVIGEVWKAEGRYVHPNHL